MGKESQDRPGREEFIQIVQELTDGPSPLLGDRTVRFLAFLRGKFNGVKKYTDVDVWKALDWCRQTQKQCPEDHAILGMLEKLLVSHHEFLNFGTTVLLKLAKK